MRDYTLQPIRNRLTVLYDFGKVKSDIFNQIIDIFIKKTTKKQKQNLCTV